MTAAILQPVENTLVLGIEHSPSQSKS